MSPNPPSSDLRERFALQHAASRQHPVVPLELRHDRLRRLAALLKNHGARLADAVQADFGVRSADVTQLGELVSLNWQLRQSGRKLAHWARRRRAHTPMQLAPGRGWTKAQPLGVVGIISPWNYPIQLSIGPAIAALAAGNRVLLKPSELTPATSACLAELLRGAFAPDEFDVVLGDAAVAAEFASLPFDHLVFTGSTRVGRMVAAAAAENMTPTTLELGGKSPCIVDADAPLERAMPKIVNGKLLNCGQTCIAPDYVLLPRGKEAAFARAFEATVKRFFPTIAGNPDYTALLDARGFERMQALLDDARAKGARVLQAAGGATSAEQGRQMAPALVFETRDDMRVMQEEIFGPILPVVSYGSLDEAIAYVNARPRPLALYWFGQNAANQSRVLEQTVSGGVTVNDTLFHFAHEGLPFGGVGDSGWGAYHGEAGFLRFSHLKPVFEQSRMSAGGLLHPPYGALFRKLIGGLARL